MFKDISFGQYYPGNSIIHRLDPRVKLLLTVAFIVGIFFIKSYFGYVVTGAFLLLVILLSRVPMMSVIKSLKTIVFIVIFTSVLNLFLYKDGVVLAEWKIFRITDLGVHTSIKIVLRLVLLIMGASILTLTTTPMALTDGIESICKPLKVLRFPVHDMAIIMSIALRFIPTLLEETHKIMNAQKARGASFDTGGLFSRAKAMLPILIPLFVSSFRRADELSFALDARCYNASPTRTKMKVFKLTLADLIATVVTLGVITVILVDRYYFMGLF